MINSIDLTETKRREEGIDNLSNSRFQLTTILSISLMVMLTTAHLLTNRFKDFVTTYSLLLQFNLNLREENIMKCNQQFCERFRI